MPYTKPPCLLNSTDGKCIRPPGDPANGGGGGEGGDGDGGDDGDDNEGAG